MLRVFVTYFFFDDTAIGGGRADKGDIDERDQDEKSTIKNFIFLENIEAERGMQQTKGDGGNGHIAMMVDFDAGSILHRSEKSSEGRRDAHEGGCNDDPMARWIGLLLPGPAYQVKNEPRPKKNDREMD